jgi:hypothetical protein
MAETPRTVTRSISLASQFSLEIEWNGSKSVLARLKGPARSKCGNLLIIENIVWLGMTEKARKMIVRKMARPTRFC